jgi:nucleoside-diphosphate-sugar epimerase
MAHCSCVGVIGDVATPPADENSPCRPTNVYEESKLAGEQAVLRFAHETGFPVAVVRPAWVYGPRCPRTEKLFRTIGKRRFLFFGRGDNLRHPIYVSDAICGLELCARRPDAVGQVCILAGAEPVSVDALVRQVAETIGVPAPSVRLPIGLGILGGAALEAAFALLGKSPPFSRRSMDFFVKNNGYDISKARRVLGFEPQVDLRTGLEKSWRWLQDRSCVQ